VKIIAEDIKDLNELKQIVVDLKNSVKEISEDIKTTKVENDSDYDLNNDGKVTSLEMMVVRTLQSIASNQQKTFISGQKISLWMLISTLTFLAFQVIFGAFGIQLPF
jgi:hypothetical protein